MTTTFADLGVSDDLCSALSSRGITEPFAIQSIAIPDALAGRDVCGKARTGSGKTLAFGIPVLENIGKAKPKRPLALALVPTRELAVQVSEELIPLGKSRDVSVTAVYGGANIERQIARLEKGVDFIVATPGRMIDLVDRKAVDLSDLTHVIVDEADRMADMGFLPQVEWLLRQVDGEHQTLLFSATLDGVVDSLVRRYQTDPVFHEVESPQVTIDQMVHRFVQVHGMDKVKVAAAIADSVDRTIMFTATKHMADRLARELKELGVNAAAIHGDLRQSHREKALNDFAAGKLAVMVATDVAARGIHVDDVEIVIHYDPPAEHKTYLHRSGRTARAGGEGLVVTLVLWNEELDVKRMQKRVGLDLPIVEMFSNDSRLTDLASWDPAA
ncbi:MAG: DEAD/DEAH box helicase [Acidimicrobiales bacterium]|nr:DEAD/DEAH box helicase [Acidimicrobiales bacterium]RZV47720.1 MAG: DEAD/DEAH box helicase [Acidimicrobiales bacterium]